MNEGVLELPDGWHDETVNVFVHPEDGCGSLVVTRGRLSAGEAVESYVKTQLDRMKRSLRGFELLDRRPIQMIGMLGGMLHSRWTSDGGPVEQLMVHVPTGSSGLLVLTGTSPAPMSARVRQALLASIMTFSPVGGVLPPVPEPVGGSSVRPPGQR